MVMMTAMNNKSLLERMTFALESDGIVLSKHQLRTAIFPLAEGWRRPELSQAFKVMTRTERMSFMLNLVFAWKRANGADRQEIVDCFGPGITPFVGRELEVVTHPSIHCHQRHILHIWVDGSGIFPDAHNLSHALLFLASSPDQVAIEDLADAASI
jgi:hypothetical protein